MQEEPFDGFDLLIVAVGLLICIFGGLAPAMTWTGFGYGEASVIGAGGGSDPLANGATLLAVKSLAIVSCVVALAARLKSRVRLALLAACVALLAAAAFAAAVPPPNVMRVYEVWFLRIDYGSIRIHPWIWAPAIGQLAVLSGLCIWAIRGRQRNT